MKDSDFLRHALAHLGAPERWCQRAFFRPTPDLVVNPDDATMLRLPALVGSMCLDGALQLTQADLREATTGVRHDDAWDFHQRTTRDSQINRVRQAISETFFAQYPDIVAELQAKHAGALVIQGWDEDGQSIIGNYQAAPTPQYIPVFNDHNAMSHAGVVAVIEKTIADLTEAGR